MKSKETLTRLTALAEQHMENTGDRSLIAIVWSAEENAGDSGFTVNDSKFAGFVLSSMQDLLSSRDHAVAAAWYANHGFTA